MFNLVEEDGKITAERIEGPSLKAPCDWVDECFFIDCDGCPANCDDDMTEEDAIEFIKNNLKNI